MVRVCDSCVLPLVEGGPNPGGGYNRARNRTLRRRQQDRLLNSGDDRGQMHSSNPRRHIKTTEVCAKEGLAKEQSIQRKLNDKPIKGTTMILA